MTFKDFLKEMMDTEMTPAEYARVKRQAEMNPKAAAMKHSKKQGLEAKAAEQDDAMTPEQKKAEKLEALAARQRMLATQKQKTTGNEAY